MAETPLYPTPCIFRRVVSALLLAFACVGCDDPAAAGDTAMPPGEAGRAPDVGVVTVRPQPVALTAELPGRTQPYAVSEVRPQVSGILKTRLFAEGSRVNAGDVLYQIDDTLYRAAYASAQAQLQSAEAAQRIAALHAERRRSLLADQSISRQDYDDAEAALQQAEATVAERRAEVDITRINLGYTRITAPISGRIGRSYLTQGALVTANQNQVLATIQTLDPIYVDMNQSTSELLSLRGHDSAGAVTEGGETDRVSLTLDDGTPYAAAGTLRFSESLVDATTGTVTLRAEFPNPDGVLLPGMFVRATIVERVDPEALLIPQRGVSRDERGNPTAMVVGADGIVQGRRLTVDRALGSHWLVTEGIRAGDRVVVEGLQYVRPGQPANPVPFEGDTPEPTAEST
jgi:membrane fusion protein (multidrug efflux system)